VLAGVIWGIRQRYGPPAVPLLTPDSWGYLHPALSWLGGAGFQQTEGRAWFYPAIVALTLKLGGDFSWLVRLQQCLGLAGAPLLWLGLRIWLSIFSSRTFLCHAIAVSLAALTSSIYLLNTTQVRFELTIQPEGVLAFFVLLYLVLALGYIRARWVSQQASLATFTGAVSLLASYSVLLLKPSWGFALIPSLLLLFAGFFGTGPQLLRLVPAVAGIFMTGCLLVMPHLLGFRTDSAARTFLPFTLVSIHAAQIIQNAEKQHWITSKDSAPSDREPRFYQELRKSLKEARAVPLDCPTLGFAPDYIMYTKDFFRTFASEENLTDTELINLCYSAYFKTWIGSPDAMLLKIAKEMRLFISTPSRDFAAHSVSESRMMDTLAHFSFSPKTLLAEAQTKDYLRNQPAYLDYLANLQKVYQKGYEIDCVNWLRYVANGLAEIASFVQLAFIAALFPVFWGRKFNNMRLPAIAAAMVSTAVYGNALTVGIVHTLDLDRYRTSYLPALLLTLAIMMTFLFAVVERTFRRPSL
jgi:hypothetical protein